MASIQKRIKANGEVVFKASIVIKKEGRVVHRESKTFPRQKLAKDWGIRREVELQENTVYKKTEELPLRKVIERYQTEFPSDGTKNSEINALLKKPIAKINVHTLTVRDLITHIRERNKECKPQTAAHDLIWISKILKTMKGVVELETDMSIFTSAREILKDEGLVAKPEKRTRRPTPEELWALSKFFGREDYMLHVMWFAIYSCRRQGEITKLQWADIKHENRTCLIRDLKDPKIKNKIKRCKLPKQAYRLIMRQERSPKYVFPYNSQTISAKFTNACCMLEIDDLHFHDLRREGTSRLFEAGLTISQVAQITLHEQWATLKIYTSQDPGDLDI